MTVTAAQPRIGGWLLLPLAWLIMTLLTSALVMAMYLSVISTAAASREISNVRTAAPSATGEKAKVFSASSTVSSSQIM